MEHGIRVSTVNLSTSDPSALARFYAATARAWEIKVEEPRPGWSSPERTTSRSPSSTTQHYQPPVWPSEPGKPPTQVHLEVQVTDLAGALEHALACGARLADHQPQEDVRVCLDPAGHPFCLWVDETGDDPAASG